MNLPITPPFPPMEALLVDKIPVGNEWQYEPKWDGFRCLAYRDRKSVQLQSRSGQNLTRYFPELLVAFGSLGASRFVLDGEIAVPIAGRFSFDDLLQRIHPAESRVRKLAQECPAIFVAFDLLVSAEGRPLVERSLAERRQLLEEFADNSFSPVPLSRLRLSPATKDLAVAKRWFEAVGGDLDGLIAKRLDLPYQAGERTGMQKVKKTRTADCVVGGFRYATKGKVVGSLLLGLYNDQGLLDHVGFCSDIKVSHKAELTKRLEKRIQPPGFTGRAPGGPSRWSAKRSTEWEPLKPELVVEVSYDHFTGGRFRHGTGLVRWRPDKTPAQCRMDQVQAGGEASLKLLAV